ncbi:MAG: serine/threonine-protein kinase, partial [Planctomycetota bacterium]
MPSSRVGPLALESQLGEDPAASSMWHAVHVKMRKPVAVKLFPMTFGGTAESKEALQREWKLLQSLDHPAIARCYGGGLEKDSAYIAYAYVDGETLKQQIERRGRLPWETVLDYGETLAEALGVAHGREVYHGALDPTKVMINGLDPSIVDFRVHRTTSTFRNNRQPSLFEMAFWPPEKLNDPQVMSAAGDLFSLGALLYYGVTGELPATAETLDDLRVKVMYEAPPKAAALAMDCPVWLSAVVEHLMQKDANARPHGAPAVMLALQQARRRAVEGIGVEIVITALGPDSAGLADPIIHFVTDHG